MIDLISLLIFLMFLLAGAQFLYESVIAPSIRIHLRYRVFASRDELRRLHANDDIDENAFMALQHQFNAMIHCMSDFHVSDIIAMRNSLQEPRVRTALKKSNQAIASCNNPEFLRLKSVGKRLGGAVLAVNSGGLMMWIIPLLVAIGSIRRIARLVQAFLLVGRNGSTGTGSLSHAC